MAFEIITNETDINAGDIPQNVINDIADILYNIFARVEAENEAEQQKEAV